MALLGLDISHFQGAVNFAQVKASGRDFVVLKCTDGIGYTDPTFAGNRKAAHAAGLVVGIYHFAQAGNPVNEAAYFCGVVGKLQSNEFLVLDWEKAYSGDHVAWCKAWLDAVRAKFGVAPFIYMNRSTMTGRNWGTVASTYGLWLAQYDGVQTQPAVTSWSAAAMKQFSDAGTVPGVASPCDVDVFYGTTQQLLAYCTPGGTDVATADDVWNYTIPARNGVGPASAAQFLNYAGDFATQAVVLIKDAEAKITELTAKVDALTALVQQLAQTVAASPGMTCQGNPQAVLTALGNKLATPDSPA